MRARREQPAAPVAAPAWCDLTLERNVGRRVHLPSGQLVMLLRPDIFQQAWHCAYCDALGRVRMVRGPGSLDTHAHTAQLSVSFLAAHGRPETE